MRKRKIGARHYNALVEFVRNAVTFSHAFFRRAGPDAVRCPK
jgi:hypothetical protein